MLRTALGPLGLLLLVGACTGSAVTPDAGHTAPPQDAGTIVPDAGSVTVLPDEDWCTRARVGPGPAAGVDVGLSQAHALVRYFGPLYAVTQADDALVAALQRTNSAVEERTLAEFAVELPGVCRVVVMEDGALPVARVERQGTTAVVFPGTGPVDIPSDVTAVALDLRNLAEREDLNAALDRAVAASTAGALEGLQSTQVERTGLTDEAFYMGLYTVDQAVRVDVTLVGTLPSSLPLAVVLGETVAPTAARWAARLRLSGRAWLVGASLDLNIAESRVVRSAGGAVLWRNQDILHGAGRAGDTLQADEPNIMLLGMTLARGTAVPPPVMGSAARPAIQANLDFGAVQSGEADVAHARAALLSAHGAYNLFFPYFDVVGNQTSERLAETLANAATVTSRFDLRELLRRLANAIQDGHGWTTDNVLDVNATRFFNVFLDDANNFPVVARSYATGFAAGDTLLSLDGVPADSWLLDEMGRAYGATDGSRRFNALQELTQKKMPLTVRVRNAAGVERDQPVVPGPRRGELFAGSSRTHGHLGDLGHPDLFYMNLDGGYAGTDSDVNAALTLASGARALLLDMRGHPASRGATWDPYAFLQRLMAMSFDTPRYRVPVLVGGEHVDDIHPYEASYPPLAAPSFHGPVVFMVDRMSVSFAEDLAMMLLGANRAVAVVGRPTAGTTGSVTGMQLPAGFSVFMTGMEARWPNGETFYGRGAIPTVLVTPTAQDYANGEDPFLRAAIAAAP